MVHHVIAIDQGTTSTRAIVYDATPDGLHPLTTASLELRQQFPAPGWVEHDPDEIWQATVQVVRNALDQARVGAVDVAGIGITNQRETTIVWDRATGTPIHRAIVWQDRRTADRCAELRAAGAESMVTERTGLLLDPYFSATKIAWILDHVPAARARAERNELAFGTIESFLLWRLTGGSVHATDATNAARTLLLDIRTGRWDEDLLALFGIPRQLLPTIVDNAGPIGMTTPDLFGASIPILGLAGDQHAAMIGQAALHPGMAKSTYGTGCFALVNTGPALVHSRHRLLSTIAYRLDGVVTYALEGSIFVAGAAIQWLRDGLGIIDRSADVEALAARARPDTGVYLVPAFVGLGAPYWDADARGALLGLTRDTGPAEIARATLEAVAFQSRDLIEAMRADGATIDAIRVDGGMVANDLFVQILADTVGVVVERPTVIETTALGAAYLAGLAADLLPSPAAIEDAWACDRAFHPTTTPEVRDRRHAAWLDAVQRVRSTHG
jgi:glycerol kinase